MGHRERRPRRKLAPAGEPAQRRKDRGVPQEDLGGLRCLRRKPRHRGLRLPQPARHQPLRHRRRGAGDDPDRQGVPQRLRHQAADRRVHHAPGGRICPGAEGRRDSCRRRSDPSAAAGRSAAARCRHHPFGQGQPGRAGGQERPPHRGDAHRRRLCGGRDDAPARRGQGAESTAHPSGRWPSGEPYPDHRRHRLLAPGHHPRGHLCRGRPQRPRHR